MAQQLCILFSGAGPNPSCVGWDEMGSNPPFAQPGGGRFMVRIIASK